MKRKKEDIYIMALKYGKEHIGKPIKYSQVKQHLDKEGYEYDEFALRQFFAELFVSMNNPQGNRRGESISENQEFYLEQTGYFSLLEHEELQDARRSSILAKWFAIIAIFISIVSTAISIYFSIQQLNKPTSIESSQFEKMQNDKINEELNEIKNTQLRILNKLNTLDSLNK